MNGVLVHTIVAFQWFRIFATNAVSDNVCLSSGTILNGAERQPHSARYNTGENITKQQSKEIVE